MKSKTSLWNKFLLFINSIVAFLLLLSYALPYVFPASFPILSVLSLTLPVLIVFNVFFLFYWVLKIHHFFMLSLIVLAIGYKHLHALYQNNAHNPEPLGIHFMSYNTRLFNHYDWIKSPDLESNFKDFFNRQNPDIIGIQEFHSDYLHLFDSYPFRYIQTGSGKIGQAIFSNFPMIDKGNVGFLNTSNGAIYSDIVIENDTIRFYNIHLESLRIDPKEDIFSQEESQKLLKRMGEGFTNQQLQSEQVKTHLEKSPHPNVVVGDFNNTQFSYVYKSIRGDYKDAFEQAGRGLGATYMFKFIPLRIDFVLFEPSLTLHSFKTHSEEFSDHNAISARFVLD